MVDYRLPYPKHEFLSYLVHHRGLLAHGSNLDNIVLFEPRQSNDAGTYLTGVYAANDGIWPMFFATVARGGGRLGLPVRPVARLCVTPQDFPFRQATVRFSIGEPLWQIRRRFRRHARSALA